MFFLRSVVVVNYYPHLRHIYSPSVHQAQAGDDDYHYESDDGVEDDEMHDSEEEDDSGAAKKKNSKGKLSVM